MPRTNYCTSLAVQCREIRRCFPKSWKNSGSGKNQWVEMVVWLCFFLTLGEVLEGFLIYIYIIDVFFSDKGWTENYDCFLNLRFWYDLDVGCLSSNVLIIALFEATTCHIPWTFVGLFLWTGHVVLPQLWCMKCEQRYQPSAQADLWTPQLL